MRRIFRDWAGRVSPKNGVVFNPRKVDRVEAVFLAADGPLHVDEVADLLRRVGEPATAGMVRGAVSRIDVVNTSFSTYVHASKLARWRHHERGACRAIRQLMEEDPAHQWNATDLLSALADVGHSWASSMPPYVLDYLMSSDSAFKRLGRNLWGLGRQRGGRLSVQDLAVAILERAGHPLTHAELENRARSRRSIGKHMGVRPPLVRLADGRIGLAERDLGLDENDIRSFASMVRSQLSDNGGVASREDVHALFRATFPDNGIVTKYSAVFLAASAEGTRLSRGLRFVATVEVPMAELDRLEASTSPEAVGHDPDTEHNGDDPAPPSDALAEMLTGILLERDSWTLEELRDVLRNRLGEDVSLPALKMRLRRCGWVPDGDQWSSLSLAALEAPAPRE